MLVCDFEAGEEGKRNEFSKLDNSSATKTYLQYFFETIDAEQYTSDRVP